MTKRLTAIDFSREIATLPWGDTSQIAVELDGQEFPIERVCIVEDTKQILIVCTPDPLTE